MSSLLYQMSYDTDATMRTGSDAVAEHARAMRERSTARRQLPVDKLFAEWMRYEDILIPCPFV